MAKKSKQLDKLFGEERASALFENLESLDPKLNEFIQTHIYDDVWEFPPLSLREKSMITIAALLAVGNAERLGNHIIGFLNCGGNPEDLRAVFRHLAFYCGFPAALSALKVLKDILDNEFKTKP
jgi:4-carboxymuconolactone decarboxylase